MSTPMKLTKRSLTLLIVLFFLSFPATAYLCGTERWAVKVAQDEHVNYFFKGFKLSSKKLNPAQTTTIAQLHRWAWPFGARIKPPDNAKRSSSKVEYQIWTVTAFLIAKSNEDDKDYHLILTDGQRTLVAEIPHPDCVRETPEPIRGLIKKARKDFDEWWTRRRRGALNQKVRVTGLGFFDTLGHAKGTSPNGIELHPVIAIKFLD